jgi:hypothetical protein
MRSIRVSVKRDTGELDAPSEHASQVLDSVVLDERIAALGKTVCNALGDPTEDVDFFDHLGASLLGSFARMLRRFTSHVHGSPWFPFRNQGGLPDGTLNV